MHSLKENNKKAKKKRVELALIKNSKENTQWTACDVSDWFNKLEKYRTSN